MSIRAVDRLDEQTRHLHAEMEGEATALLQGKTPGEYQRYLARTYGFIAPLERCLLDTPELGPYLDDRRLRKHLLIEHDLQTLGLRSLELQSIPQCMWIPWFDNPYAALGWAYIIERTTLEHPTLFRHLATVLPGEGAFAASFLKVYAGSTHEMWQSFADGIELATSSPRSFELILDGARSGYRYFKRWRNTLDGKALSGPHVATGEQAPLNKDVEAATSSSVMEES